MNAATESTNQVFGPGVSGPCSRRFAAAFPGDRGNRPRRMSISHRRRAGERPWRHLPGEPISLKLRPNHVLALSRVGPRRSDPSWKSWSITSSRMHHSPAAGRVSGRAVGGGSSLLRRHLKWRHDPRRPGRVFRQGPGVREGRPRDPGSLSRVCPFSTVKGESGATVRTFPHSDKRSASPEGPSPRLRDNEQITLPLLPNA